MTRILVLTILGLVLSDWRILGATAFSTEPLNSFPVYEAWLNDDPDIAEPCVGGGECPPGAYPKCDAEGMITWRVSEPNLNVWLIDQPLSYQPAYGPEMAIRLYYRTRTLPHAAKANLSSVGDGWGCNMLSFIEPKLNTNTFLWHFPGGGRISLELPGAAPIVDFTTSSQIARGTGTSGKPQITVSFRDGSQWVYEKIWNSSVLGVRSFYYLREIRDPQKRALRLGYDNESATTNRVLLRKITDAQGRESRFEYESGSNRVSRITDPYGRSTRLSYDSSKLSLIRDAAGLESSIKHLDERDFSITTPYGITRFQMDGETNLRTVLVSEPEGMTQAYLYSRSNVTDFEPETPPSLPDATFHTQELDLNNSFYWNRQQTAAFPGWEDVEERATILLNLEDQQYLIGRRRQWISRETSPTDFQTLNLEQMPSRDGEEPGQITWYDYSGKPSSAQAGTLRLPLTVAQVLPGGSSSEPWFSTTVRNARGNVVSETNSYTDSSGDWATRTRSLSYDSSGIDLIARRNYSGDIVEQIDYISGGFHLPHRITLAPGQPEERVTEIIYDLELRMTDIKFPSGFHRRFEYHPESASLGENDGRLAELIDRDGPDPAQALLLKSESFTWKHGQVHKHTDPRGFVRTYTLDGLDRLLSIQYGSTPATTLLFGYTDPDDPSKQLLYPTTITDRLENTTTLRYNGLVQVTEQRDRDGNLTTYDYCGCGSPSTIVEGSGSPEAVQTDFEYDFQGNRIQIRSTGGQVTDYDYNSMGQLDGLIHTLDADTTSRWDLDYTNHGLLKKLTFTGGTLYQANYDLEDRLHKDIDREGIERIREYNHLGQLTKITESGSALTKVEAWTYSSSGMSSYVDALGETWDYERDARGLVKSVRQPSTDWLSASQIHYFYDMEGQVVKMKDEQGHETHWFFDVEGRLKLKQNHTGTVVLKRTYDHNGNIKTQETPAYGETAFDRNNEGQTIAIDYPSPTVDVSYSYDALGRIKSMTDAAGTSEFRYRGYRLAEEWIRFAGDAAGQSNLVTFSYAPTGQRSGLQLSEAIGPQGDQIQEHLSYHYDEALRVNLLTLSGDRVGEAPQRFEYKYRKNLQGAEGAAFWQSSAQWRDLKMPNQMSQSRSFDALGRLEEMEVFNRNQDRVNRHAYTLTDKGQRASQTLLKGNKWDYSYDSRGRLETATGTSGTGVIRPQENFSYHYDQSGNPWITTQNQLTTIFETDAINELDRITRSGTVTASGMTSEPAKWVTINGQLATRQEDNSFYLEGLSLSSQGNVFQAEAQSEFDALATSRREVLLPPSETPVHDNDGNLIQRGPRSYRYDAAHQLVGIEDLRFKVDYRYDGLGRLRIRREYRRARTDIPWANSAQRETRYLYDGRMIIRELDQNNAARVTYTRGLDLSGTLSGAGGIGGLLGYHRHFGGRISSAYYHSDGSGNITAMSNEHQDIVARYQYDPYGNLLGMAGPLASRNPYRFSSKQFNSKSGLYYYGFRFYDPSLQRWINQDPIGELADLNLYRFNYNDPINFADPNGLWGIQFGDLNFGIGGPNLAFDWDSFADFGHSSQATIDGLIPFFDPFASAGENGWLDAYDPCESGFSLGAGRVAQFAASSTFSGAIFTGLNKVAKAGGTVIRRKPGGGWLTRFHTRRTGGFGSTYEGLANQGRFRFRFEAHPWGALHVG